MEQILKAFNYNDRKGAIIYSYSKGDIIIDLEANEYVYCMIFGQNSDIDLKRYNFTEFTNVHRHHRQSSMLIKDGRYLYKMKGEEYSIEKPYNCNVSAFVHDTNLAKGINFNYSVRFVGDKCTDLEDIFINAAELNIKNTQITKLENISDNLIFLIIINSPINNIGSIPSSVEELILESIDIDKLSSMPKTPKKIFINNCNILELEPYNTLVNLTLKRQ